MNLFDTVMKGAAVRRLGELSLVIFGTRGGSLILESLEFQSARKWAQQKTASGNEVQDLALLLGRLDCYVSRYGSGIAPKGTRPRLLRLAKAMRDCGYNHEDWNFSREVADEMRKSARPGTNAAPQKPQGNARDAHN